MVVCYKPLRWNFFEEFLHLFIQLFHIQYENGGFVKSFVVLRIFGIGFRPPPHLKAMNKCKTVANEYSE